MNLLPELEQIIEEYKNGYYYDIKHGGEIKTIVVRSNIINIPDTHRAICTRIYSANKLFITEPGAFENCMSLKRIDATLDISKTTDLSDTFANCRILSNIHELVEHWDVRHILNMNRMFKNVRRLSARMDLSTWDVRNCKLFDYMFYNSNLSITSRGIILKTWYISRTAGSFRML
jgi:hypothetical protein